MDILSVSLLLVVLVLCTISARLLLQSLHSRTKRMLGWAVGLSAYGAWSISFLKSNWDPHQGAKDWWIVLLWLALFPHAFLLAFPPGFLKEWKAYLLAVASFLAAEIYLFWSVVQILGDPNFDDSAGAGFALPMMLLPIVLLICLLALRLFACAFKRIWNMLNAGGG
jgi:hypothetical protein